MTMQAIREFLNTLDKVREGLAKTGIKPHQLLDKFEEPPHAAGLTANLVPMAFSNDECCMDFYQVSPFVRSALQKGGELFVEPVVRVMLPTGLFLGVIERLDHLASHEGAAGKPSGD